MEVEALLKQALTDRASLVRVLRRPVPPAPLSSLASGAPRVRGHTAVLACARVDPTAALRPVDIGPAADDAATAAKFRAFWGPAAELRRFQDGKISEAVVWGVRPGTRHTIPDQIAAYAINRHKPGGGCGAVVGSAGVLDGALGEGYEQDAAVAWGRALDAALDKLGKQLRGLEGTILKVVGVQPLGPAARHTAAVAPRPHPLAGGDLGELEEAGGKLPRCLDPVEVLVQLESSGGWPFA